MHFPLLQVSFEGVVTPPPGSIYERLGDVEPVNLLSFAYQIASGMVSWPYYTDSV